MAGPHPEPRKALQWRLECLAHTALEGLVGLLPGSLAFHLGEAVAGIIWHLMPVRRRLILRNLRIAFGGRPLDELAAMAKASFRRAGANLVSVAHTSKLSPRQLPRVLDLENRELLDEKIARGRGVIILLSHMGNWELLARLIHLLPPGTQAGAFYRPLNNPRLDERVLKRRQTDGTRMFSKRDPFHQVCAFLREGGVVGILADQRAGPAGEVVPFFGRLTRSSPLPSLLARRTKSEVVALSLAATEPGKWKATLIDVADPPTTRHCMTAIEQAMGSSPVDVFWLQERWRCYLKPDGGFEQWLGNASQRSDKPHRLLLWLTDIPTDWTLPPPWQHPDVDYEVVTRAGQPSPGGVPDGCPHHIAPATTDRDLLAHFIDTLDRQRPLPIDAVAAVHPPPALRKACKRLAITFVDLGDAGEPSTTTTHS